jgi:hypothetical protein
MLGRPTAPPARLPDRLPERCLSCPAGPHACPPAWCVTTTDDDRKANMVWHSVEVQHVTGSDFVGTFKPTPLRTPSGRLLEDTATEMKVSIPILVNAKPLKDGEELVYLKEKVEKAKRALKPICATSVSRAKKARPSA